MGFALASFDPIGRWRDHYPKVDKQARQGPPIDTSRATKRTEGERRHRVKAVLLEREPKVARCLTEKMLTYATGRILEAGDLRLSFLPARFSRLNCNSGQESWQIPGNDVHVRLDPLVLKCGRLAALLLLGSSKTRRNSRRLATFIQTHLLLRHARMAALPCLLDNTSSPNP